MGEEEKKMEEKKPEEKKEESKAEESKETAPPQDIVLRVFMHCEGCAKKVRRCLKGFEGVEDVQTDCKAQKVVVKGEKADPVKVLERVQRKSHRQVELISPVPKPAAEEDAKKIKEKEVAPSKSEEKKEEGITVVLKVHMHCEACAQEIKRRILRMNGVENVEPDLKSSQVTVKGAFDPSKLVEYVNKRTGKNVLIVKQEPEKKEEAEKGKEEKKAEKKGEEAEKGDDKAAAATTTAAEGGEGSTSSSQVLDMKRSEFYPNYSQNYQIDSYLSRFELNGYAPQMFSDENPNACSVM
ncbi:heavy metal-associated isoprenylated plant protein 7-like isoform X2 [Rhododendron vialii]|uniref:heavy metal-associated isoprenylated plant protein 7-like isoform X2 n=1 Tax=Rhododendron vialii TaxID=182163 RepID=UPI00265DB1BD|nr:heavy metal-associated isoprenylated plant protein 7-like isoform X2 [Rhododendron vialii]